MNAKFSKKELVVGEWIKRANEDELSASVILKEGGALSTACFLCQQMAEKYFKTFLVANKKSFPKIHQLDLLIELCIEIDKTFEQYKNDAIMLSDYYVETRYPGDYPEFSESEAEEAFEAAKRIKDFVLEKIK